MMSYGSTDAHLAITEVLRQTLNQYGLDLLRADDNRYHDDIYWNIMTYVYGCSFGIALFERIESEIFNPNIAFELGYMYALGKPVCLLKDRTMHSLQTDIIGKLFETFDTQDPRESIVAVVTKWLKDKKIINIDQK
jgi:nucleoside 2-deoxyribosyltransferase